MISTTSLSSSVKILSLHATAIYRAQRGAAGNLCTTPQYTEQKGILRSIPRLGGYLYRGADTVTAFNSCFPTSLT